MQSADQVRIDVPDRASWPGTLSSLFAAHVEASLRTPDGRLASPTPAGKTVDEAMTRAYALMVPLRPLGSVLSEHLENPDSSAVDCEFVVCFLRDLFESCCGCSLLTAPERAHLAGKKAGVKRKRKGADQGAGELSLIANHFAALLPAEYLLRMCSSLPLVLDHYVRVNGGIAPPMGRFNQAYLKFIAAYDEVLRTP